MSKDSFEGLPFLLALESAALPPQGDSPAPTIQAAPSSFVYGGMSSLFSAREVSGAKHVDSAGAAEALGTVFLARSFNLSGNLSLGNMGVFDYFSRFNGLTPARAGVPVFCAAIGETDAYDASSGRTNYFRFAGLNAVNLNWSDAAGQELMAGLDIVALARQTGGAVITTNDSAIVAATGQVCTWHNLFVSVNGGDFRSKIASLSLAATNNIQMQGCRNDYGASNALSRTPYNWRAGKQQVTSLAISCYDPWPENLKNSEYPIIVTVNNVAAGGSRNYPISFTGAFSDETRAAAEASGSNLMKWDANNLARALRFGS